MDCLGVRTGRLRGMGLAALLSAFPASAESLVREPVWPVRIVWQTNAVDAALLTSHRFGQVPEGVFLSGSGCRLSATNGPSSVVLDFGCELHGAIQIGNGSAGRGTRVRIRLGESVAEAMAELGEKGAQNDHALRDFTEALPRIGSREFGSSGFRFARIDAVEGTADLQFVRAVAVSRPMRQLGRFRCSDERLNRIFDTAVRTVRLCCQDYLWDGIKRDRLVWSGDLNPEARTVLRVFGAAPVLAETLEYAARTTPPDLWMNGLPTYTLWWICNLAEWTRFTGDSALAGKHAEYLEKVFDHVLSGFDSRGEWTAGTFLDWPTKYNEAAARAGTQGLALMAARETSYLARRLGNARLDGKARGMVRRLEALRPDPAGAKSAAALLALSGLRDPVEMHETVLSQNGHAGVSTFYGYYVLEALSAAGMHARARETVRDYWGAMLDVGATTFWEDFDIAWTNNCFRIDELPVPGKRDVHGDCGDFCYRGFRHSLCHGWSSGPAAWMIDHVLGIRPLDDGCRTVEVAPNLEGLDWAEGAMALPGGGAVRVRAGRKPDGSLDVRVDAPEDVAVRRSQRHAR